MTRLAGLASSTGPLSERARKGLGGNLRSLAGHGFIDLVECAVKTVMEHHEAWSEAREDLGYFLHYDLTKIPEGNERRAADARIRTLIDGLKPESLTARLRTIVTEMSWDYGIEDEDDDDFDPQSLRDGQDAAVRKFAVEMLGRPGGVEECLPEISSVRPGAEGQRKTYTFGAAVAQEAEAPLDWLKPTIAALCDTPPEQQRDFGMLAGYLAGLPAGHAAAVEAFKRRCSGDSILAGAFPYVCNCLSVTAADIGQALSMLQAGLLQPPDLVWWSIGGALRSIDPEAAAPLFDELLDHSAEGYCSAVQLLSSYAHSKPSENVLDRLAPQLRKVAECLAKWPPPASGHIAESDFGKLMKWLLAKGRNDADARAAAMTLSSLLVRDRKDGYERMVKPLIRRLLKSFPEISWQSLGSAALSKPLAAMRMDFLLGERLSTERNEPPILQLPEEVLFAWCRANGDEAAAFAAKTLPFLDSYGPGNDAALHPRMARLIDEFGGSVRVRKALDANIFSGGFWGSASSFYGQYNTALSNLRDAHSSRAVRRWAGETLQALAGMIERFDRRDEEERAQDED